MVASVEDICNLALTALGEDVITSLTDNSHRARLCRLHYGAAREKLLRAYRWNFAIADAILAPEADAPASGRFAYKFMKPRDCLAVIAPIDQNDTRWNKIAYTGGNAPYKVEGNFVLSDSNPLYITYIKDVTAPADMDSLFVAALAFALAKSVCMALTNDNGKFQIVSQQFMEEIRQARVLCAIENSPEMIIASDWVDARLSGLRGPRDFLSEG